jgi:hypothetical protein
MLAHLHNRERDASAFKACISQEGMMDVDVRYLERRITQESIRAMMAESKQARAAHLGLLKLYRERLGSIRQKAVQASRLARVEQAA